MLPRHVESLLLGSLLHQELAPISLYRQHVLPGQPFFHHRNGAGAGFLHDGLLVAQAADEEEGFPPPGTPHSPTTSADHNPFTGFPGTCQKPDPLGGVPYWQVLVPYQIGLSHGPVLRLPRIRIILVSSPGFHLQVPVTDLISLFCFEDAPMSRGQSGVVILPFIKGCMSLYFGEYPLSSHEMIGREDMLEGTY